jgi:hypothetical protein
LLNLLAGDADVADDDKDSGGDDDDNDCESDLGPCHHPGPRPIVIQWADREVVGKT